MMEPLECEAGKDTMNRIVTKKMKKMFSDSNW